MKKAFHAILAISTCCFVLLAGCASAASGSSAPAAAPAQPDTSSAAQAETATPAWEPQKNIEWVVTSSPGGGSDIFTRMITDIMAREKLVSQTILVNNQTDGGGEVGRLRVSQSKDDGYLLLTFNSGDLMPMVKNTDNRIENFKPIAIMAVDRQLLLKGAKTSYATFQEAVEAAKGGKKIVIGGSKGDDVAAYDKLLASIGLTDQQVNYMMYDATSDALTALLGGHIDFCISKPAASIQYIASKDAEPVLALATERFGGSLSEVPLLSEIGPYEDIESPVWRGVVGSAAMPEEAVQFWSDTLQKVSESEAWQKEYIEKNLLTPKFMPYQDAAAYMADYQAQCLAE